MRRTADNEGFSDELAIYFTVDISDGDHPFLKLVDFVIGLDEAIEAALGEERLMLGGRVLFGGVYEVEIGFWFVSATHSIHYRIALRPLNPQKYTEYNNSAIIPAFTPLTYFIST